MNLPVEIYEEIGSSETLNRPVSNKLLDKVKRGEIRCIAVLRLDRFTRKVTDTERLLTILQFHDVTLIETSRKKIIDYNSTLELKLQAMISDVYREYAKMVLNTSKKRAVQLYGRAQGGTPPLGYVYNKNTGKYDINEDIASFVKKVFKEYLDGKSTLDIYIKLNEQGYRTSKGGLFQIKSILDILKNEKYIGIQVYGKYKWIKDEN